ncbi:MAG: hypothetical protein HY057_11760, partial [Rhodospirillales bacterium]|nr:hypothetical protein [Rhodospirillales bacterium]
MLEGLNESIRPDRRFTVKIALAGLALVVAAAIGVGLVFRFVADERARELRGWQARLGLTADSRAAAV